MGVQQNVTKVSFTNVLSPILKLPLLNRRMSDKESAELKTIVGTGMVNFVQNFVHMAKKSEFYTKRLSCRALPLVLTWREKCAGIRKPKR